MGNSESTAEGGKRKREDAEREEDAKKSKDDPWGDGSIHDYASTKEWSGNFIVLGTTGSGKTTLIRYMTTDKLRDLAKHGDFRMSTDSVTVWEEGKGGKKGQKEARKHESAVFKRDGVNIKLGFRDTVGFGAKDMESKDILKETVLSVASDLESVRGCIFVHKCERCRAGGAKDIEEMKDAMKKLSLDFNKHLLLVITHSAHLSKEKQNEYTKQIRAKVSNQIPENRVIHVNFANLAELNEDFRKLYLSMVKSEFEKMLEALMGFEQNVLPGGEAWKKHFEQINFPAETP